MGVNPSDRRWSQTDLFGYRRRRKRVGYETLSRVLPGWIDRFVWKELPEDVANGNVLVSGQAVVQRCLGYSLRKHGHLIVAGAGAYFEGGGFVGMSLCSCFVRWHHVRTRKYLLVVPL